MTDWRHANLAIVEKISGIAFLESAHDAWNARSILCIGADPVSLGVDQSIERIEPGGGWWDRSFTSDRSEELAQLSTSSGTTGKPKIIALSRRAISDTVERLIEHMELDSSIREYVGVPVTYSFGLARTRAVGAVGGRCYLPENGFRPDELAQMLADGEVNALSAVPTMLRTLLGNPEILRWHGDKLRWLEIGSQYMTGKEKRQVRDLFPNAIILQHYGLTEASRSTFLRIDRDTQRLDSVGRAVGDGGVRIGRDGQIEVRGSHIATGLLEQDQIRSLSDEDGWLTTGDRGEIRDGWVYYIGRSDDVANIGGIKISAEAFERSLAEELGENGKAAACVIADPLRGQKLGIAIKGDRPDNWQDVLKRAVAKHQLGLGDVKVIQVDTFPVTETGKLRRAALAGQFENKSPTRGRTEVMTEQTSDSGTTNLSEEEEVIAAIWRDVLNVDDVKASDRFYDLGGDSLSAIAVMLRMEQAGIPKELTQRIFEGDSIAELAARDGESNVRRQSTSQAVAGNAINFTRGVLVLIVILAHWGPFAWDRAGAAGRVFAEYSWPMFRFGTPGFAMVFGLGLGFFWSGMALTNTGALKRRIRTSFTIVASGLAVLVVLKAAQIVATDAPTRQWPTDVFYDVLLFYTFAVLSIYPVLRLITARAYPVLYAVVGAILLFGLSLVFAPLLDRDTGGFIKLAETMLAANYSYPLMMGYVLIGLAAGLWVKGNLDRADLAPVLTLSGMALLLGGIVMSHATGLAYRWFVGIPTLPAIVSYSGVMLLILAGALVWQSRFGGKTHLPFRVMAALGILAFPAYVAHAAAMPGKRLLEVLGVPSVASIAIVVGTVLVLLAYAVYRVDGIYFRRK